MDKENPFNFKKILVVGAGSVGGYFGARLARKYDHVSFLLRPRTLQAVQNRGLTIRSHSETFTVHPRVTSNSSDIPPQDLIILGVKAYDLDEVLNQIEPILQKDSILLTLQNGVTIEDQILARIAKENVVGGVAFIYSKIAESGVIDHYKRGTITIGELDGKESPRLNTIGDLFKAAGVPCLISSNIRQAKWEKMCWNCVFNPLTVMINDCVAKALDLPEMLNIIPSVVREVMAVAAANGVPLAADMPEKVVQWSQQLRDIHTSMYDDWKAGRPTEIEYLNGYIARKGRDLGIPTPLNEAFTALVKAITQGERMEKGRVRVEGEIIQPVSLDAQALVNLPNEFQVTDVSKLAPGFQGKGVRIEGILEMVTAHIQADHVTFHSEDGQFSASLSLQDARDYGILLYEVNGMPLAREKGGPFRLIAPGLGDLCANVKHVSRIELTKGTGKDTRPSLKTC